jgi:hypothetical protein
MDAQDDQIEPHLVVQSAKGCFEASDGVVTPCMVEALLVDTADPEYRA